MLTVRPAIGVLAPRFRRVFLCAVVALLSLACCASASAALNLTGTWSANYHCETGSCAGSDNPATDTLTQAEGSDVVTGSNAGETITGTLTGNTFVFESSVGAYTAKATLTVAANGLSWSGPLEDSNHTTGTYTATRNPPLPGSLSQLAGPFDCIGETTSASEGNNCGTLITAGTNNAFQVQLSPDGKNAYSVSVDGDLIEYSRNGANGELEVIGCITAGTDKCAAENVIENEVEITNPTAIALSPNGKNAYITGIGKNAIVEFERNTESGLLAPMNGGKACITEEPGGECEVKEAKGLHEPYGITVSPEPGENVYATAVNPTAKGEAVAEFKRNTESGLLEPLAGNECIGGPKSGCPIDTAIGMFEPIGIVVSSDGKNVYVAAGAEGEKGAVVTFEREGGGALKQLSLEEGCIGTVTGCAKDEAAEGSEDLVVSPDNKDVYATSAHDNATIALERTGEHGALTALAEPNGCISLEPTAPTEHCTQAKLVRDSRGVAISPEGDDVYVGSAGESGVAALERDPATGALTPLSEPFECVTSKSTGCGGNAALPEFNNLLGLKETRRVVVSPDGTNVYVAGQAAGAVVELARAVVPTVTGLNPNQGPYTGGTEVTIEGTGFIEGATVKFGSSSASEVHVHSASSITARAPAGSATVDVVVTTSSGTSATGSADKYGYGRVGGLNINGYCESLGDNGRDSKGGGPAALSKEAVEGPEYAYNNWGCVAPDGSVVPIAVEGPAPSMNNACVVAFPGIAAHASPENPNNAYTWVCYEGAPPPAKGGGGGGGGGSGGTVPTAKAASLVTSIVSVGPLIVPPPVLAKTGNVAPVSGAVLVKVPGTSKFVPLSSLQQVPFGSVIEATNGTVSVTTALPGGKTQTGEFFSGEFILRQGANGVVVAELTGGNFAVCPTKRERSHIARAGTVLAQAAASGGHVVRKLWANAHGKFSTKGNYAAGAVQGTEWLTEDLCDGTLIKVTRDKVAVTNLVTHHHVEVTTGHHYLAKAP
jgi:hypothetical protein